MYVPRGEYETPTNRARLNEKLNVIENNSLVQQQFDESESENKTSGSFRASSLQLTETLSKKFTER
jgi:hypothetical protein